MEKKVEMKATKKPQVQEEQKLSYDELEKIAQQLSAQCQQMAARLQAKDMELTFKRLDYLFQVVSMANEFPSDFVKKSIEEIVTIMTPEEEPKAE